MRLVAERLAGERGGKNVFRNVDFSLGEGRALVVTGANGTGKSTLLRVIAGLLPTASGTVRVEDGGEDWPTPAAASHYVGHFNAMKPALTLAENLGFWRDYLGEPRMTPAKALAEVGLETIADLPFAYLSTGQKRRAALARLLVSWRPVWLLDEPTAGLDKASEEMFGGLMRKHLALGGIVVAATHLPLGLEGAREMRMGGN